MFILSSILNNYNDYTRRTRTSTKGKACGRETCKDRSIIEYHKGRIAELRYCIRTYEGYESIRIKSKQFKSNCKSAVSLLSLFFLYNPNILSTLIYIDTMFTDEMIAFNMVQLNSIFQNIQTFINIGVV